MKPRTTNPSRPLLRPALTGLAGLLISTAPAAALDVSVDPSGRYYRDTLGRPVFLSGYYDWASVAPGFYIDHPSQYATQITQGAPYGINYIRISLGINRFTASTDPPSWNGQPTPVPFLYVANKADLDQWDPVFWDGLRSQCDLARQNGVLVHVALFDGVDIRGGSAAYRWANSFWNIDNQTRSFFGDLDVNNDGNADANGDFYRLTDFNNNTGVGYYQRRVIAKALAETADFGNVFYEVGNELLSSPANWNAAVISYAKTLTTKPITQNGGGRAANIDGWAQHAANTPAQVKSNVAGTVGLGHPAWEDPDGPDLIDASPDELRRSAWYSFTGGAAGWGGFTTDFWAGGSGFNAPKATYYRNLQTFISDADVQFQNMVPRHDLVGNSGENSCLANVGTDYVAYVLNDLSVNINLSGMSGTAEARLYDPRSGTWSGGETFAAGGSQSFNRPAGAEDWVVHVTAAMHVFSPDLDEDGDVDQSDFGLFQTCIAGEGSARPSGCEATDSDGDGDVDRLDFNAFESCYGGPNLPPGC